MTISPEKIEQLQKDLDEYKADIEKAEKEKESALDRLLRWNKHMGKETETK